MKICPVCNEKENDDDERFCTSCGLELNASSNVISDHPPSKNIEIESRSNFKTQGKLMLSSPKAIQHKENHCFPAHKQ